MEEEGSSPATWDVDRPLPDGDGDGDEAGKLTSAGGLFACTKSSSTSPPTQPPTSVRRSWESMPNLISAAGTTFRPGVDLDRGELAAVARISAEAELLVPSYSSSCRHHSPLGRQHGEGGAEKTTPSSGVGHNKPSFHLLAASTLLALSITAFLDLVPSLSSEDPAFVAGGDKGLTATLLSALYSSAAVTGIFVIPAASRSLGARSASLSFHGGLHLCCLALGVAPFLVLHLSPTLGLSAASVAYTLFGCVLALAEASHLAALLMASSSSSRPPPSSSPSMAAAAAANGQSFLVRPVRHFVMGRQGLGPILYGLVLGLTLLWDPRQQQTTLPGRNVAAAAATATEKSISHENTSWQMSPSEEANGGFQLEMNIHGPQEQRRRWHPEIAAHSSSFLGEVLLSPTAWRTLLGFGLIACGAALLLQVLLVAFATEDERRRRGGGGGGELRRKEETIKDAKVKASALRSLLGGLGLYLEDDHVALLMPMVTFSGMQSGFVAINFLKACVVPHLGLLHLGAVVSTMGAGRVIGCWFAGQMPAVCPKPAILGFYSLLQLLILLFNLAWRPDGDDRAVFYAVAFAWGFTEAMAAVLELDRLLRCTWRHRPTNNSTDPSPLSTSALHAAHGHLGLGAMVFFAGRLGRHASTVGLLVAYAVAVIPFVTGELLQHCRRRSKNKTPTATA